MSTAGGQPETSAEYRNTTDNANRDGPAQSANGDYVEFSTLYVSASESAVITSIGRTADA